MFYFILGCLIGVIGIAFIMYNSFYVRGTLEEKLTRLDYILFIVVGLFHGFIVYIPYTIYSKLGIGGFVIAAPVIIVSYSILLLVVSSANKAVSGSYAIKWGLKFK